MKLERRILMLVMAVALLLSDGSVLAAPNTLTLPAALQIIEEEAFYGDQSIDKVELGDDVKEIRERAFANSTLSHINLPANMTFIDDSAFDGPNKVTVTATEGTYAYNWAIKNGYIQVPLPESQHPYANNTNQTWTYTHPTDAIIMIITFSAETEFENNYDKLTITDANGGKTSYTGTELSGKELILPGNTFSLLLKSDSSVQKYGFKIQGIIAMDDSEYEEYLEYKRQHPFLTVAQEDNTLEITGYEGNTPELIIPDRIDGIAVSSIGDNAFRNHTELSRIIVPGSIRRIGSCAFQNCTNVHEIELCEGLVSVGWGAFDACSNINAIVWPSTADTIPFCAFRNCSCLKNVFLPKGLTTICSYAFESTAIESIRFPETVSRIDTKAFYNCHDLYDFNYPIGWTDLQYNYDPVREYCSPFIGCDKLTQIVIPEEVTTIPDYAFKISDTGTLYIKGIIIGSQVTSIGKNAFYGYQSGVTIYGQSGSYAQIYANDNYITFKSVYASSNRITISGRVTDGNGNGIQGISVRVNDLSEADESGSITIQTDAKGNWTAKQMIASHHYNVTYNSSIYEITPNSYNVYLSEDKFLGTAQATLLADSSCPATVTATVRDNSIVVGEEAVFDLTLINADKVRLIVDGIAYEEYDVTDGQASVKRRITKAGERKVQFQAGIDGNWGGLSNAIPLTVSSSGTLAEPVFALNDWYNQGDDVSLDWNSVVNATDYTIYVYWNGGIIYKTETKAETVTIPGTAFPYQGEYSIEVIASGLGYSQNGYSCPCVINGNSLDIDVGEEPGKVGKASQIRISSVDAYEIAYAITDPDGKKLADSREVPINGVITIDITPSLLGNYTVAASAYAYGSNNAYKTTEATFVASNWVEVDQSEWEISSLPASHDFTISASGAWNVTDIPDWISTVVEGDILTLSVNDVTCIGKSALLSVICDGNAAYILVRTPESAEKPTIVSPVNGATVDYSNLNISWNAVEGAQEYYVSVKDTTEHGKLFYETIVKNDHQISIASAILLAGHNYQVNVTAYVQTGDDDNYDISCDSSFSVVSSNVTTTKGRIVDQNSQPVDSCIIAIVHSDTLIAAVSPDSDGWWSVQGLSSQIEYTFDFYYNQDVYKSVSANGGSTLSNCVIDVPDREFTDVVTISYAAGTQIIETDFTSVSSVVDDTDWLSTETKHGSDNYVYIELAAIENTANEDRVAIITVTANGGIYKYKVNQAGAVGSVHTEYLAGNEVIEESVFKKGWWFWEKNKYTGAVLQATSYTSDGDTLIDVNMQLASDTVKRGYMNSYTYGTEITINGSLEINSTITFAPSSKICVYGNVKVGKNGVLDMTKGGKLEVYGNLEFKSDTDHSSYVPKAAIVLYDGFKALKEQGLLSAASITLKNYDKYFFHADELLYTSNELSRSDMQRIQLAVVKLLEGKWFETEVFAIRFKMYIGGRISMQEFSYFDSNGNLQHYKVGIEQAMVTQHGQGEVGAFQISYARGNETPRKYWIYQDPAVTQNQMNACYRAIAYQGIDSIKEIKKWLSGDIVQDAAIFIVTQMADVIGDKSIPEAFASFDKNYKKLLLDIIEG